MMTDWIKLDRDLLNTIEPDSLPVGSDDTIVRVFTSPSPHAIPTAIRGSELDNGGFRIDFRYLDEERTITHKLSGGIRVIAGKNSDRIMSIIMGPSAVGDGNVGLEFVVEEASEAVDQSVKHARHPGDPLFKDNVKGVSGALLQARERLARALSRDNERSTEKSQGLTAH